MKITILGCYSATPREFTNPTAQVVEINKHTFLVDCGEGTQVQLRKKKIKFNSIKHVFISHLHGDHFFGLIGFISTLNMTNRVAPLTVYGPAGIKEAITIQLKLSKSWTVYPLHFKELSSLENELLYEDEYVTVTTIPLQHRIYCNGFLFQAKPNDRTLNIAAVLQYGIEKVYYNSIKKGKDITLDDGSCILNELLTTDPDPPMSYAFCSDTRYDEVKIKQLQGVKVLYHEATFQEAHQHLCLSTGHSTAKEAARIAKLSNVTTLILGHYSTRYKSLNGFKLEAETQFDTVLLAEDGKEFVF